MAHATIDPFLVLPSLKRFLNDLYQTKCNTFFKKYNVFA